MQSRSQGTREDSRQAQCQSNAFLLAMSPTPKRLGGGVARAVPAGEDSEAANEDKDCCWLEQGLGPRGQYGREVKKGAPQPRVETDVKTLQRLPRQGHRLHNWKFKQPAEGEGWDWKAKLTKGANGASLIGVHGQHLAPPASALPHQDQEPPAPPKRAKGHLEVSSSSASRR